MRPALPPLLRVKTTTIRTTTAGNKVAKIPDRVPDPVGVRRRAIPHADKIGYADLTLTITAKRGRSSRRASGLAAAGILPRQRKSAPNATALAAALATIEANAKYGGTPERKVFLRVGGHEGRTYLDLCDRRLDGDRNRRHRLARCRRSADSVHPPSRHGGAADADARGGSLATTLRGYVNLKTDDDFILVQSWLLGALPPDRPLCRAGNDRRSGHRQVYGVAGIALR